MAQMKCPKCGSTNSVMILYAPERHRELYESDESIFFMPGSIPDNAATKHCKDCGENFDVVNMVFK